MPFFILDSGVGLSFHCLAEAVASDIGITGTIRWDTVKPDGAPMKQLDLSRLEGLGWRARIMLAEGLASTVALFREQSRAEFYRV